MAGWYCGTTREGPAISRARAAVLLTTLTFLLSSATAHAKPTFGLTETSARAGDLVHFTIAGVDGSMSYALEVDGTQVLDGTSDGGVSGTFTVPDLGDESWTVTVDAKIRGAGKRKNLQSELQYLGSALPVTDPPAQAPAPAVPVVPQAAPSPQQIYSPDAVDGTSPAPAVKPRSRHRRRHTRKRHAIEVPRRVVARSGERRRRAHRRPARRKHDAAARKARSKRAARRTAPLFDGIPVPGGGLAPRPALLVATTGGRPAHTAIVVPTMLGLAAIALAGTALLRRRRLASRRGRG
jgi:hypothetical protein